MILSKCTIIPRKSPSYST